MGHVYTSVTLQGTKGQWTGHCFVDTGAAYSILSPSLAEEIGVTPTAWMDRISVAEGRQVEAQRGYCDVSIAVDGQERSNLVFVWVMEGQEEPIIGTETLELLGLKVDPTTERVEVSRNWLMRM